MEETDMKSYKIKLLENSFENIYDFTDMINEVTNLGDLVLR